MSINFAKVVQFLFTQAWHFLTAFYLPGTNVTPAGMLLFLASIAVGFRFLKALLGMNVFTSSNKGGDSDE